MDTKQPLSLFLVAVLAASVFTVVGITSIPLQNASAQAVTIETSADDLGETFFGEAMIQVIIEDPTADDDSTDTLNVEVDLTSTDGDASQTINIPDTTAGSQRFEFFILHVDSTADPPADPEETTLPLTDDQLLEFGDGAGADELGVTGLELYDDASFDIRVGNVEVTINYEEMAAELTTDRDTFGTNSFIYVRINDQDANLDPTDTDSFTVNQGNLTLLFDLNGASFVDDVTFDETGDNTAEFEARVLLTTADSGTNPELDFTTDVVTVELNDMANYNDAGFNNAENDSVDTSEVSIEIDDVDGDVDEIPDPTLASELKVTVRDHDQNRDSEDTDTIDNALNVDVDITGGDSEQLDLEETDDNTGVFELDLSNSELRITFLADGVLPIADNGILELRVGDIDEDIIVSYEDPLDDDSSTSVVAEFTVALLLTAGQVSAPGEVGVTDEFTVTLTEPDLNDNPRTRDSYTFRWNNTGPHELRKGTAVFGDTYTFEIELDGEALDFGTFGAVGGSNVTTTLTETGINTGVFEFDIDVEDISDFGDDGGPIGVSDGDQLEVSINDFMADDIDPDEDTATIVIGKPSVGLDYSRTTVPIPPEAGSESAVGVGTTVVVVMSLTDPTLGTQTNVQELIDFVFGTDEGEWMIETEGDEVNDLTVDSNADFFGTDAGVDCDGDATEAKIVTGVSLCEIMGIANDGDLEGFLEESGKNTGVFEADLEFTGDADMDSNEWQDMEVTFTFTNDEGDEESAGFTFRGSDGIVTVDQPSAKTGTLITITVEDQDLNLDDAEIDEFESGDLAGPAGALLLIETEDEQIEDIAGCPGISDDTFEETGEDTGVFSAVFEVGDDIPVSCLEDDVVESASNILITYDDDIDSTGGGGDELEVSVPLATATGSLQVSPTQVGPATTITILITDTDLDEDSAQTDDYETTDPTGDDFFISFSSSRNEVGEGSPDIEETGPNTGVFMFELELVTDEQACQDDDLDGSEFDATGGDTESTIGACPGDLISIRYEDEHTGGGGSATISEVVEVSSWDPEFVADKESYSVGDRVTISISDPDANTDSDIADSLTDIRVTSDSDRVGDEFSAIETGKDTGVFRLTFGTSAGAQSGSISVKNGDDITIRYTDEFPADFEEQEEDKDFEFTVPVGGPVGGAATVTAPEPRTPAGQRVDTVNDGQQVVLTTDVRNTSPESMPFVALIEVRDSTGITIYLAWQTGTLNANSGTQVGLSWTPDQPGDYTVRTFVISSLQNPRILSPVAESEITVE